MQDTGRGNGKSVQKRAGGSKKGRGGDGLAVLDELIALLKHHKVEYFKNETHEIKLSPIAFLPTSDDSPRSDKNDMDDRDELLFYSAPPREHI